MQCLRTRSLRTRRFSEAAFRPCGATNITNLWKNTVLATFPPFRATKSSFFWLFLFSDLLSSFFFSSLLFSSLALRTSAFPSVHIVGSLTSKLPSIRGLLAKLLKRSVYKHSIRSLLARSPKVTRGLRAPSKNEHRVSLEFRLGFL